MNKKTVAKEKLTVVCDLDAQPFSLGDMLNYVHATIIKCISYQVDKCDFVFICNPLTKAVPEHREFINQDNKFYCLYSLLPLMELNPYMGGVYVFDSWESANKYLNDNAKCSYLWPSFRMLRDREYLFYKICRIQDEFYRFNEYVPELVFKQHIMDWVNGFIKDHVLPDVAVTLNIRNNPRFQSNRNTNMDVIYEFMSYCENRYPVKFIIICGTEEIDSQLDQLSNVVFAKKYYSGMQQDLALIHSSIFHIGAPSGPAAVAVLGKKPFFMFNQMTKGLEQYLKNLHGTVAFENSILRFTFNSEYQYASPEVESVNLLINYFKKLYSIVDTKKWTKKHEKIELSSNRNGVWLK